MSEQGAVLLKNRGGVLPLTRRGSSRRIGATAQGAPIYTGGGSASVVPSATTTPLDGIKARAGRQGHLRAGHGRHAGAAGPTPRCTAPRPRQRPDCDVLIDTDSLARRSRPRRADLDFDRVAAAGADRRVVGPVAGTFTPTVSGTHRFSLNTTARRVYLNGAAS